MAGEPTDSKNYISQGALGRGCLPHHWPRVGDAKCFGPTVTCFLCCEQWRDWWWLEETPAQQGPLGSPLVPLPASAERYQGGHCRRTATAALIPGTGGREERSLAARSPMRPRAWGPGRDEPRIRDALRVEASGVLRPRTWRFGGVTVGAVAEHG